MAEQANNDRDKKKNKVNCMGCKCELDSDHTGVVCVQDHHICTDCSVAFVSVVMEAPEQNIPIKCMICKQEVVTNTFERQLTQEQAQIFLLYNMQYNPASLLGDDEIIASCPFCNYFEINTKDPGHLVFYCKNEGIPDAKPLPIECCLKTSCIWCKKLIKNKDSKAEDEKYDMEEKDVEKHFECARLAPHKAKWDEAIEAGLVGKCPQCGVAGQKDGACTHMTCAKCRQKWCYCCGLKFEECDKRDGITNWAGHNNSWRKNPNRCPMYLEYIRQVDPRWPSYPDECVAFFHRLKCMVLLKKAITEMGDENYKLLCASYDVDKNCGYDMEEVMKGEHTLIKRPVISYGEENHIIYDVDENNEQICFQ